MIYVAKSFKMFQLQKIQFMKVMISCLLPPPTPKKECQYLRKEEWQVCSGMSSVLNTKTKIRPSYLTTNTKKLL